jgi:hypothetical protein
MVFPLDLFIKYLLYSQDGKNKALAKITTYTVVMTLVEDN